MDPGTVLVCLAGMTIIGVVGTVAIFCDGFLRLKKSDRGAELEAGGRGCKRRK